MGTRNSKTKFLRGDGDHPHAYGDKSVDINGNRPEIGSSPRVWGQAVLSTAIQTNGGIIPTRMGTRHDFRHGGMV